MNDTLIFQHIPKTAGSTMHKILSSLYKRGSTYNIFATTCKSEDALKLNNLSIEKKHEIKLLKGHLPYGIHNYMENECMYITIIRNPVKRVISNYFYMKLNKHNKFHDLINSKNMGIGEFIQSGVANGMNNGQIRWLTDSIESKEFGSIDLEDFNLAIKNIENKYSFVGINEKFDESLVLMSERLNWKKVPYYRKSNVNKSKKAQDISDKDLKIIENYNSYDISLYEFINSKLNNLIDNEKSFESKLNKYKKKNKIYQIITSPLEIFS